MSDKALQLTMLGTLLMFVMGMLAGMLMVGLTPHPHWVAGCCACGGFGALLVGIMVSVVLRADTREGPDNV